MGRNLTHRQKENKSNFTLDQRDQLGLTLWPSTNTVYITDVCRDAIVITIRKIPPVWICMQMPSCLNRIRSTADRLYGEEMLLENCVKQPQTYQIIGKHTCKWSNLMRHMNSICNGFHWNCWNISRRDGKGKRCLCRTLAQAVCFRCYTDDRG